MITIKKIISCLTIVAFIIASGSVMSSCGNKKKGYKKVKSGSGMGNKKHKNKHVWGK